MFHNVSFSGGKDSTAMLLMMCEKGMQIDSILFVDMTKEFPAMYEHIQKVEDYIQRQITRVVVDFDYYFSERILTRGKRVGERGYGWPGPLSRWCTARKISAMNNYMKSILPHGEMVANYVGIAADEPHRVGKNNASKDNLRYPLVEWGITENQALKYCYKKGFDFGGLYEKMNRVSCFCCPLTNINNFRVLYKDFPELWHKLEEMDSKSFRKIRKDYSVADLKRKFESEL